MNHSNFPSLTDPLDNNPMFEDELFHQLFIGHQLDQEHSVEPLFAAPAPAPAPSLEPAVENERDAQNMISHGWCETNKEASSSEKHNVGATRRKSKMMKEKTKTNTAVEVERQRRQNMSSLHSSLRSLLPTDYIKGKRSMSDHVHESARYIKDMEGRIKALCIKRDELKSMKRSSGGSSSSNSCSSIQEYVTTVKDCGQGLIDIVTSTCDLSLDIDGGEYQPGPTLSKLLQFLGYHGLNVVNCVSSRVDNRLVHNIQAQVDDGRDIDLNLLEKQLTNYSGVSSVEYKCGA